MNEPTAIVPNSSKNGAITAKNSDFEIVAEKPHKTVYRRKYGVIRVAGEKDTRRITAEELKTISDKSKLSDPNAQVLIASQKIKIPLTKIVFQQIREEITEEFKDFAKLPTKMMILNEDFTISDKNERWFIQNGKPFIMATAHIFEGEPILEPMEKVKSLHYMVPDGSRSYPHRISKIVNYGEVLR